VTSHEPAFLDTAYVYASINTRDQWHTTARRWQQRVSSEGRRLLTTQFILLEIADGLAALQFRQQAVQLIDALENNKLVEIVPASPELIGAALQLYRSRPDKSWGLTDCSSFVVMQERGLQDALTADEHFGQAGFRPLMLGDAD